MTRAEKIERLKKYRLHVFYKLKENYPRLIEDPNRASPKEIAFYNEVIAEEARRDSNNEAFRKRFSF